MAWNAASGGVALARDFAIGSFACAGQANNDAARNLIATLPWFRCAEILVRNIVWMQLLWIVPLLFCQLIIAHASREHPGAK